MNARKARIRRKTTDQLNTDISRAARPVFDQLESNVFADVRNHTLYRIAEEQYVLVSPFSRDECILAFGTDVRYLSAHQCSVGQSSPPLQSCYLEVSKDTLVQMIISVLKPDHGIGTLWMLFGSV